MSRTALSLAQRYPRQTARLHRHILANLQRFAKNSVRELGGQLGMNDVRLEGENIVTVNLYGLGLLIDSQ